MPLHDWTKVDAGLFHHFRQRWIGALCDELNGGRMPPDYFALLEQNIHGPNPALSMLRLDTGKPEPCTGATGLPSTRRSRKKDAESYLNLANRATLRNRHGKLKAAIEIVSPGNKASEAAIRAFVMRAADMISQGIHLLVIDVFSPTVHDPQGIANAIWAEFVNDTFDQLPDKPLTLVSFDAGEEAAMCLEPIAMGDELPDMPLQIRPDLCVEVPLESTYQAVWQAMPEPMKKLLT
jgi:hypothetical protein